MQTNNYFLKLMFKDQQIPYSLSAPLVTIGSSSDTTITVPKGSADERHCRIERRENNQFVVRDLRSSSGTYLNGARIIEAYLQPGDTLRINDLVGEFHSSDTMSSAPQEKSNLKSRNASWQEKLQSLPSLARTQFPVLVLGPSGAGKELVAKAIHEGSTRSNGPFLSVNCSALSESLIESELFGHVKGSYTGAVSDRKGAFEAARGGTLFLDEIGDLPYNLQAKILRALENNEIRPLGSDRIVKTDVRIIAATHQSLFQKINEKSFRTDLFYRLNVITVNVPALIDRMEDFDDILFQLCRENRVKFSFQAIDFLKRHRWPGNIRELKNVISRASALFPGRIIEVTEAQSLIDKNLNDPSPMAEESTVLSGKANLIKEMEKQMIVNRLIANKGNQRRTATDLGMPKSTLHDRIKTYKIDLDKLSLTPVKA